MKSYIEFITETTAMKRLLYSTSPKDPNYKAIRSTYRDENKTKFLYLLKKYKNSPNVYVTFTENLNSARIEHEFEYDDLTDLYGNPIYPDGVDEFDDDAEPLKDLKHPIITNKFISAKKDAKASFPKLNPLNIYMTPLGIYLYPISYLYDLIVVQHKFTFGMDRPFACVVRTTASKNKTLDNKTYTEENYE